MTAGPRLQLTGQTLVFASSASEELTCTNIGCTAQLEFDGLVSLRGSARMTGSSISVRSGGLSLVDQSSLIASGRGAAASSGPGLGMSATSNGGGAGAGHGGGGGGGESSPGPRGSGYICYTPNLKMLSTALLTSSSTTSTSLSRRGPCPTTAWQAEG